MSAHSWLASRSCLRRLLSSMGTYRIAVAWCIVESKAPLCTVCRWTPDIKRQIKQSRLDTTNKVVVSAIDCSYGIKQQQGWHNAARAGRCLNSATSWPYAAAAVMMSCPQRQQPAPVQPCVGTGTPTGLLLCFSDVSSSLHDDCCFC